MTHSAALDDLLAHAAWARSLARRLVEDQAAADDVVQDLWVAALRRPPATDRPLKPWIAGVVRKLAGRRQRTATRRHARERAVAQPEALAPADEPVARAEAQRMLVDEVLALDEPLRTTVLQRYFDGLEPAEIARATGVPAGTVRWRLSAAREQLRSRLDARHGDDRRAWAQALIPFAAFGVPRKAVLLTPTLGAGALGGLLTMKMFWNAAALLLVALLAWVGLNTVTGSGPVVEPTITEVGAAIAAREVEPKETEAAPPPRRALADAGPSQPRATPPDAPADEEVEATIRLRCIDEGGQPVRDVVVRATHHVRSFGDGTLGRSDAEGVVEAALRDHPRSLVGATLELSGAGLANTTLRTNLEPSAVVDLGDVVLAPGAWIRGRVVDRQGTALRDVEVRTDGRSRRTRVGPGLFADTEDASGKVATRTDADGRFELVGVALGSQELHAELGSQADEVWMQGKLDVTVPDDGLAEVQLVVAPPADAADAIHVVVVDPDGAPVSHASIRLRSTRGMSSSSADDEGRRLFRPRIAGPFTLVAEHPRDLYLPVRVEGVELGDRVELRFAPVERADVRFTFARTPSPGQVELGFSTPPTRSMLGGLFGRVGRGESKGMEQIHLDPDSDRGTFRVPDGPFVITATAPGHLPVTTDTLDPDHLPEPLTIAFEAARQVFGRVVDQDGAPLQDAEVGLFLRSFGRTTVNGLPVWIDRDAADTTRTDADGRYRLDWIPDRIGRVRVTPGSGGLCVESGDLAPDSGDLECDLVARPSGTLEGRLLGTTDPAGTVIACSRGDGFARTTRADADGRYRFEKLLPGDYRVLLRDDEIDPHGWSSHTGFGSPHENVPTDCTVVAGETTLFDLREGALGQAYLKVRIVIPGRDLAGAALEVFDATAEFGASPRSSGRALVDADGNALLRGLATGPHRIISRHQGVLLDARVDLRDGENRFDVVVDATGTVNLTGLPPGPGREFVDGVVFVTCELPNAMLHFAVLGEGDVSMAGLPAGPARLQRSPTRDEMRTAMLAGNDNPLELLTTVQRFTIPAAGEIRVAW